MPKAVHVPALNLAAAKKDGQSVPNSGPLSPRLYEAPRSPRSGPTSPALNGAPFALQQNQILKDTDSVLPKSNDPSSPHITAMPEIPPSPGRASPKQHSRDVSKSFFSNLIASKSSHKLHAQDGNHSEHSEKSHGRSRTSSKDRSPHPIKRQASTPDLPKIIASNNRTDLQQEQQTMTNSPTVPDLAITKQKSRSKLGGMLNRSKSNKPDEDRKVKKPAHLNLDTQIPQSPENEQYAIPMKTAPPKPNHREQAFINEHGSALRNRSADRAFDRTPHDNHPNNEHMNLTSTQMSKEGTSLFANIQHTGRGVGDRLGRAGRGFFNKMTRSGSTTDREPVNDENYICTTINLPLVKQTRKTRIAKRMELSKDKTEFWMPALPWRCIDYLNMQCEQEGLYRVPGSGRDVKLWQRRFDTEYDINLFEEPELYDVNTIASMFKAWLRDLPDELLPKSTQRKISEQCAGAQKTPQLLKDELSKLPPFNYYLLFAITCHLSLLHSYADQNKMDYRNLCICFQPCLRIDAFCFQFLVIDWKECWQQGCWTEKQYLEEEYRYEKEGSVGDRKESVSDDRAISSSGSSMHAQNLQQPPKTADAAQRAHPIPLRPKQRSLSSSASQAPRVPSHGHTQTAPAVPRLVSHSSTPEQKPSNDQALPELGNLSPIRM